MIESGPANTKVKNAASAVVHKLGTCDAYSWIASMHVKVSIGPPWFWVECIGVAKEKKFTAGLPRAEINRSSITERFTGCYHSNSFVCFGNSMANVTAAIYNNQNFVYGSVFSG